MRELIQVHSRKSTLPKKDNLEYKIWHSKVHTIMVLKNVMDLDDDVVTMLMHANNSLVKALAREAGIF